MKENAHKGTTIEENFEGIKIDSKKQKPREYDPLYDPC